MSDSEGSPVADAFFENNGLNTLLPFLKLEYFRSGCREALWCLATLAQSDSKHIKKLSSCIEDLISNFEDPSKLHDNFRQYLVAIEHTCVCLIFIFHYEPELIPKLLEKVNSSYLTQLVRYKRESLSIIACLLINIVITNHPEQIPNFLGTGIVSDLIYGVKSNPRIACEVMNIFSLISSIKTKVHEMPEPREWIEIAEDCVQGLVRDPRIVALITDSMKIRHITVVKPLLDLLGNIISGTDTGIEKELILIPEFKEMLTFCFESESGILQRLVFWVLSNMLCSDYSEVIRYFILDIDLPKVIMSSFIDHDDILVQREAALVLYYVLVKSEYRSTKLFNNHYR